MSRTIKYEFLKIFTSKLFLYTLLAFVLADTVILIYTGNIVKKDEIPYSAYKILNEELKDLPESEKEELINKEYERKGCVFFLSLEKESKLLLFMSIISKILLKVDGCAL